MHQRFFIRLCFLFLLSFLTSCGGGSGDNLPPVNRIIVFGDSMSDSGTYAPAAQAVGGGKFTVNPGMVWVEEIARKYQITITPAITGGFGITSISCPSNNQQTCTNFAQGGSRVTDINGIGHASGALTLPILSQMDQFLQRQNNFSTSDLVFVFAGHNDVLFQANTFDTLASAYGNSTANQLVTQSIASAATELASYVQTKLLNQGAKRVVIMKMIDPAQSPAGTASGSSVQQRMTQLTNLFNQTLQNQLPSDGRIFWYDSNQYFQTVYSTALSFNITNKTIPVCDAAKIAQITAQQITNGSSLFCSTQTLVNGLSADTSLFADGLHPTPAAHKILANDLFNFLTNKGI
jgi:phospholipase/lecithinase/hemolysin